MNLHKFAHIEPYLSREAFQSVDIIYLIFLYGVLCELKAVKHWMESQENLILIRIQS